MRRREAGGFRRPARTGGAEGGRPSSGGSGACARRGRRGRHGGRRERPGGWGGRRGDPAVNRRKQERVVVGARVRRRGEMPANVEPVGQAAADKLRHEGEQSEGERREKALMPTRPVHGLMVLRVGAVNELSRLPSASNPPGSSRRSRAEAPAAIGRGKAGRRERGSARFVDRSKT